MLKKIPLEFKKTLMVKLQECMRQSIQQNGKYFKKVSAGDENVSGND